MMYNEENDCDNQMDGSVTILRVQINRAQQMREYLLKYTEQLNEVADRILGPVSERPSDCVQDISDGSEVHQMDICLRSLEEAIGLMGEAAKRFTVL